MARPMRLAEPVTRAVSPEVATLRPALKGKARVGERRDARLEVGKPSDELRVALTPALLEPQVEVAERAGEGDVADMVPSRRRGVRALEKAQGAVDLAGLVVEPFRLVSLLGPP